MNNENYNLRPRYILIVIFIIIITLVIMGILWITNMQNILNEQRTFCNDWGGSPIEPSRGNYYNFLCIFNYEDTYVVYGISKRLDEKRKEIFNYEYDYCFSCWDRRSCSLNHNDILRDKGVHC